MGDQPDWYSLVKADIIAQSIATLAIDIAAQTLATLGVNIKAQDLAKLAINITAQDLAQLVISISAQTVGIYLQPEWAAKTGVDKNFFATGDNIAAGDGLLVSYTVTAGKTLYITQATCMGHAYAVANADLNQAVKLTIQKGALGPWLVSLGGWGGCGIALSKPMVFSAGENMRAYVYNQSNHAMNLQVAANGYEV